jgi:hypothetical protein
MAQKKGGAVPRPLTDQEQNTFNAIQEAPNMALVQVTFDGQEAAVIAAITVDRGEYVISPLAVLLTDDMLSRLALDGEAPTT